MKIFIEILLILSLIIIAVFFKILLPLVILAKSCENRYKFYRDRGYTLTSWHDDSPYDMAIQMGLNDEGDIQEYVEDQICGLNYDKGYYISKAYLNDTAKNKLKMFAQQLLKKKVDVEDGIQVMSAPVKILAASSGACNALFSHYINSAENNILGQVDLCSIGPENSKSRLPHFKLYDLFTYYNWEELVMSKKSELDTFFGNETQIVIFIQTTPPQNINNYDKWQSFILDYLKKRNITIIGIMTLPFTFEGNSRRERSILYISQVEEYFDLFFLYNTDNIDKDNQLDWMNMNCFPKLDFEIGLVVDEILRIINTNTTDGEVNIPLIIDEINNVKNCVSLNDWELFKGQECNLKRQSSFNHKYLI